MQGFKAVVLNTTISARSVVYAQQVTLHVCDSLCSRQRPQIVCMACMISLATLYVPTYLTVFTSNTIFSSLAASAVSGTGRGGGQHVGDG